MRCTEPWRGARALLHIVLLLGSLLAPPSLVANEQTLDFSQLGDVQTLPAEAEPSYELLIAQPLQPLGRPSLNLGYRFKPVWLTSTIETTRGGDWLLDLGNPRIDRAALYLFDRYGNLMQSQVNGDQLPVSARPYPSADLLFPLQLESGTEYRLYLQLEARDTLLLPIRLQPLTDYLTDQRQRQFSRGIYYGILLAMVLVNLLIYFTIHDHIYLLFSLFLSAISTVLLILSGATTEYLWGEWVWWNKLSLPVVEGSTVILAVLVCMAFLDTRHHAPRLHRLLTLQGWLGVGVIGLALASQYRSAILLMTLLGFTLAVSIQAAAIIAWRAHYRPSRYFLIAWSVFLLGTALYALMVANLLPNNALTDNILQAGVAWMAILLSLALTDRFNLLRQEKQAAQQAIIEHQRTALSQQLRTMNAISRFVPRQFLNFLERQEITDVQLGDAVLKRMTVLFTDIRGFTTLSERLSPEESFQFLNRYLHFLEPPIERNQGFVDKFIGDAIMALFPHDADQAVQAAIEMQQQLSQFNTQLEQRGYGAIRIGIGVHGGELMLGTVGSVNRIDTTVIGDTVNLAARLEELTKMYGVSILISQEVHAELSTPERYCLREVDRLRVRGKQHEVTIYELFDADPPELRKSKLATRPLLERALHHLRHTEQEAACALLKQALEMAPDDPVLSRHAARCAA